MPLYAKQDPQKPWESERERKKEGPAYKARTRKNNARAVRFVGMPPRESARRCVAGRGMVGSLLEERRIALRCVWVNVCMLCRGTGVWGVFERLYICMILLRILRCK